MQGEPWYALRRGFLGVDFFFETSGFLIVTLLLREQRLRGDISVRDFYARRVLRSFPAYYLIWIAAEISFRYHERYFLALKHSFLAPTTRVTVGA